MSRADKVDSSAVTVHGSDSDGWIRLTVNIAALSQDNTTTSVPGYNRIVFRDISGEVRP